MKPPPDNHSLDALQAIRRTMVIWLVLGSAFVLGNLMRVRSQLGGTPLLSANDRSRWSTVRSLVEHGTFALDNVVLLPDGKRNREWYSIDMVRHRGADGREHFYSSKPPLFSTIVAALYWLFRAVTGATLSEQPFYVVRTLLVVTNLIPLAGLWALAAWSLTRWNCSLWTAHFGLATATVGTLLTPFAVTLNNHLPAAVSAGFTGWSIWRIVSSQHHRWYDFALAGFFAGLTAINELPALLLVVVAGVVCFRYRPITALWAYILPVLLWAAAYEWTNYIAHGSWLPPYLHRQDGPVLAEVAFHAPQDRVNQPAPVSLRDTLATVCGIRLSDATVLQPRDKSNQWALYDPSSGQRLALEWSDDGSMLVIRQWDNWYEYEGTYWREDRKSGVDRGEPNAWLYAFHVLVGHHGIFSLTPVWLIALYGWWRSMRAVQPQLRYAAWAIAAITVICLAFYLSLPPHDRNYGGVSCGMRWTLWLVPLWWFCMIPGVEIIQRTRTGRTVAWIALGCSVFSVVYAAHNPWSHPWIFDYWTSLGWIKY